MQAERSAVQVEGCSQKMGVDDLGSSWNVRLAVNVQGHFCPFLKRENLWGNDPDGDVAGVATMRWKYGITIGIQGAANGIVTAAIVEKPAVRREGQTRYTAAIL